MNSMKVYAVRQVGTENYLPHRKGQTRGYSHDEPLLHGGDDGPRLLLSFDAARKVIWAWKQGKFKVERSHHTSAWGEEDHCEDMHIEHVPSRAEVELEVVTFQLSEVHDA